MHGKGVGPWGRWERETIETEGKVQTRKGKGPSTETCGEKEVGVGSAVSLRIQ